MLHVQQMALGQRGEERVVQEGYDPRQISMILTKDEIYLNA